MELFFPAWIISRILQPNPGQLLFLTTSPTPRLHLPGTMLTSACSAPSCILSLHLKSDNRHRGWTLRSLLDRPHCYISELLPVAGSQVQEALGWSVVGKHLSDI